MLTVAVACLGDIKSDPRPRRMAKWLSGTYQVEIISPFTNDLSLPWRPLVKKRFPAIQKLLFLFLSLIGQEDIAYGRKWQRRLIETEGQPRLIICHDLDLLPFLFRNYSKTKIILDAREYYPEQYNNRFFWRLLLQPGVHRICRKYIPLLEILITVSGPIAERYKSEYHTNSIVVESSADYENPPVRKMNSGPIKFVSHGLASKTRHIEVMIEAFRDLSDDFSLDLVLVPGNLRYFRKLERIARKTSNTRILSPVVFSEIPRMLREYDAGIVFFPPTNFNISSTLPNKFFECIQARLPLVIGPTPPMADIVEKFEIGYITEDFSSTSLADTVATITRHSLQLLAQNLEVCAEEKSAQNTGVFIRAMIGDVVAR